MKPFVRLFYLLFVFLFASVLFLMCEGCSEPRKPPYRSSVELGMTLPQVWIGANKPQYDLINESLNDNCKEQIYRFWFNRPKGNQNGNPILKCIGQAIRAGIAGHRDVGEGLAYQDQLEKEERPCDPYLLTFRDCTITDDAAISAERKRRADLWLANNPDMAKEVEKVSQEQGLSQTSKETMIELLAPDIYNGLPRPGADSILVKIDYDTESVAGIQNQQYQQQYLNHLHQMEELKKQEIENQNKTRHIRPDGIGGYTVD